jgi:hypothetical protein
MAATFKYLKKMIVTITKGPRKGTKELRYFYKGDKIPGGAAKQAAQSLQVVNQMRLGFQKNLSRSGLNKNAIKDILGGFGKKQQNFPWADIKRVMKRKGYSAAQVNRLEKTIISGATKSAPIKGPSPTAFYRG